MNSYILYSDDGGQFKLLIATMKKPGFRLDAIAHSKKPNKLVMRSLPP
jgi:hypothetical protein